MSYLLYGLSKGLEILVLVVLGEKVKAHRSVQDARQNPVHLQGVLFKVVYNVPEYNKKERLQLPAYLRSIVQVAGRCQFKVRGGFLAGLPS